MNQFQTQAAKYTKPLADEASATIADIFGDNKGKSSILVNPLVVMLTGSLYLFQNGTRLLSITSV